MNTNEAWDLLYFIRESLINLSSDVLAQLVKKMWHDNIEFSVLHNYFSNIAHPDIREATNGFLLRL